jgi:cell wall-associated NlpC family hydrolase
VVQDVSVSAVPRSSVGRVIRRRDAIGLAILVALGLTSSGAGRHQVDAAKKKKNKKSKNRKDEKNGRNASSSGSDVVREAQKYKGAKYTSGGASPDGFDCSGFTWYVFQKAAGKDITRSVEVQWKLGSSVGRGKWEPGDLVFFENTFERGLSHVGIFIKGNDFIHAENETTGVVISSLDSDYYSKHYAGARRLL